MQNKKHKNKIIMYFEIPNYKRIISSEKFKVSISLRDLLNQVHKISREVVIEQAFLIYL
jgi:hypothetical protein